MPRFLSVTSIFTFFIGLMAAASDAQMNDRSSTTQLWLASAVMVNDDTTLRSHGFFRQSLGLGTSKPLAQSWTFSPSIWLIATETHDSTRAQPEAHATLTWQHRIEEAWFVGSGATLELGTTVRDSDVKLRLSVEREIRSTRRRTMAFVVWEGVCRVNGGRDNGRLQVGIRTRLGRDLQFIAAYDRSQGTEGNGPMSGGLVALFYNIASRSQRIGN